MPTLTGVLHALTEGQRLRIQDWMLLLGAIAATVGMADRLMRRAWRKLMRPQFEQMVTEIVQRETVELRVDSGCSTIKDAIVDMRRDLAELHEKFGSFRRD